MLKDELATRSPGSAELKDIIDAVDQDGDGQIDYQEFVKLMNAMS